MEGQSARPMYLLDGDPQEEGTALLREPDQLVSQQGIEEVRRGVGVAREGTYRYAVERTRAQSAPPTAESDTTPT